MESSRPRAHERPLALLACLTIVFVAFAQLWPGLSNGLAAPISWDHGAHLGKAMLTWERLTHGLRGWAPEVECGVPLNTIYSPSGSLWVVFVRVFTPFLAWHQTYAIAIVLFRCVVGLAPYRLARVAGAGPIGAMIAGLLALTDIADHSEGGWFYDILYGVWPMSLAMCLFTLGLAELWLALNVGKPKHRFCAVLLLGAALFSHQMALLAIFITAPILFLSLASEGAEKRQFLLLKAILIAAGLLSMWWLLPMLAWNQWIDDHGQLYRSWSDFGDMIARGQPLLDRLTPPAERATWPGVLVMLGVGWSLFGTGLRRVAAVLAVVCLILSGKDWLTDGHMIGWLPPLGRIMYPRFMMIAKPLAFALSGVVVSQLFVRLQRAVDGVEWRRTTFVRFAPALLLLPLAPSAITRSWSSITTRAQATYSTPASGFSDYLAFAAWMRAEPGDFFRVAYLNDNAHIFQSAGAYTGRPAHKIGVLIAEAFRNVTDTADPVALRLLGVRYVVVWGTPIPATLRAAITFVRKFGPIEVYSLNDPDLREVVGDDAGTPIITARASDRLTIEPHGAHSIVVRVAYAPGWHATADGHALPLEAVTVHPDTPRLRYMRITVPAGATSITLAYDSWPILIIVGWLATLLGLAAAFALAWPTPAIVARAAPWIERFERFAVTPRAALVVASGAVGVLVFAILRHRSDLGAQMPTLAIHNADGSIEACASPREHGGIQCQTEPWVGYSRAVMSIDGRLRSCFDVHPPKPGRALHVRFAGVPIGHGIGFEGGVNDDANWRGSEAPVQVEALVDGRSVGEVDVPPARAWVDKTFSVAQPGTHDVEYVIKTSDANRRWFCFLPKVE